MEGKRFIHSLRLENFLSYGKAEEVELQPLNVLIGSNASGKSNLIEALNILRAAPTDLLVPFRQGGGISEFFWKGNKEISSAKIEAVINQAQNSELLRYWLTFTIVGQKLELLDEAIASVYIEKNIKDESFFYYRLSVDEPILITRREKQKSEEEKWYNQGGDIFFSNHQSILSQLQEPRKYPEIGYLQKQFSNICLYRELQTNRSSQLRSPQKVDLPENPLLEDGSNLGIVLNNLQHQLGSRKLIENLKKFYSAVEEISIKIYGGTVQIFLREEGLIQPIPANRLSDGTLRYLFLMALLLDPTPPPLICIEEPEIGLHPDVLPTIAEMLIDASQRTQLIVTTHSDALVSAIPPESVLVCERDDAGTHLHRLEPERLKGWLENYTLGDLWRMGELGGTRW